MCVERGEEERGREAEKTKGDIQAVRIHENARLVTYPGFGGKREAWHGMAWLRLVRAASSGCVGAAKDDACCGKGEYFLMCRWLVRLLGYVCYYGSDFV